MNIALVLCAAFAPVFAAADVPPAFPAEIDFLNQVPAADADKVVDAVRQYALLQFSLFEWDQEIAKQLAESPGGREEARARQGSARERLARVERAYKVVLDRYPKNARALNYYGEFVSDYRGDEINAVRYWNEAIANDPKLALAHNNLAIYYSHTGRIAFGIDHYNKAIELEPQNPDFKYNLAQLYLTMSPDVAKELKWEDAKVYREGMKLSKAAAELKPTDYKLLEDYATNFYAAQRFEITPDWADAATAWQRARIAARNNEQLFFTWLNEARAWVRKPNNAKAEACLLEALKIIPSSKAAQGLLEKVRSGTVGSADAE